MKRLFVALAVLPLAGMAAAQDVSCPLARDDTNFVQSPPRLAAEVSRLSTRVESGAIIAVEIRGIDYSLRATDRIIETTTPLSVQLAAGTTIGRLLIDGVIRDCVYWGTRPFQPPRDEEGRSFPNICLEDSDSDGSYETLRLFAYHAAAGRGIVEARVDPVRLLPHAPPADAMDSLILVHRRLRVISTSGNRVRFAVEHAFTHPAYGETEPTYRPSLGAEFEVELREGPMEVSGLPLNALHVGQSWTVTPDGDFRPWITYICDGASLRLDIPTTGS